MVSTLPTATRGGAWLSRIGFYICLFVWPTLTQSLVIPGKRRHVRSPKQWLAVATVSLPDTAPVTILSDDPLVYVIPNLLKPEECQAYQDRVQELQRQGIRPMTRSNPPEVSLEVSKLWPLPLLSILAGIPPLIKLYNQPNLLLESTSSISLDQVLSVILPPIALALVASLFLAYGVVLPLIQKFSSTSSRTSESMALNLDDDIYFCRDLVDRVSRYTGHAWDAWEAPVVTRYEPGALFARHGDASPTRGTEWADTGGQRIITCICYLNTIPEGLGGETSFDQLNINVRPKTGDALVFFPADPESLVADPRTTHESLPAMEEKWIVQMFGRIGPRVPPPLGLPNSFGRSMQQQTSNKDNGGVER